MNIGTVGDGLGWSCEALLGLAHALRVGSAPAGKSCSKIERLARELSQCRERRPEYDTIRLAAPAVLSEPFSSLEHRRTAIGTVLLQVAAAVEREMAAGRGHPAASQQRDRAGDESFAWGVHDSPFIKGVNEVLDQLRDVDLPEPTSKPRVTRTGARVR